MRVIHLIAAHASVASPIDEAVSTAFRFATLGKPGVWLAPTPQDSTACRWRRLGFVVRRSALRSMMFLPAIALPTP
jgi:hypothetical protein